MIKKGKIIFVNGHWSKVFGAIIGSSAPGEAYWDKDFIAEAEKFLGLDEDYGTNIYLDGSSQIGFDQDGKDRFKRAYKQHYCYDDKEVDNLQTPILITPYQNEMNRIRFEKLIYGMDKNIHAFYIITHSEGGAYGAGIAKLLIDKGWKVNTVIHLSTDEAKGFSTPVGPDTYQIGYTGKNLLGDWVTGNYQIRSGVTKYGIVYKPDLSLKAIHGATTLPNVFYHLKDLQTVNIKEIKTIQGKTKWEQMMDTVNHGSIFSRFNGIKLNYQKHIQKDLHLHLKMR